MVRSSNCRIGVRRKKIADCKEKKAKAETAGRSGAPRPVRARLSRQPASPVSGVLFPGGGESPTFPQVRLGCPSLWSAISGISALAGRVSGSGLWWRFSNFRFGGAETGSTADREPSVSGGRFPISGIFAAPHLRPVRSAGRRFSRGIGRDLGIVSISVASDCAALRSPWIFATVVVIELARLICAERLDERSHGSHALLRPSQPVSVRN